MFYTVIKLDGQYKTWLNLLYLLSTYLHKWNSSYTSEVFKVW
jgi:hypothetical protein